MCGNEGSLTRSSNQGALALLALRQEACGRELSSISSHGDDLADGGPAASPSPPESGPPAERPLRAAPPPKVRIKQERQLEQRLVDRACTPCSDVGSGSNTDSAAGLKHESQEPGGRQHAGQAFAALRAQAQQSTAEVSSPTPALADFAPLPEFRAYLTNRREEAQEGKARFAGLSTASEYAALVRVRREQDVHCIRKKGKKPASERSGHSVEQPGDPQRRYYLRSGNWELDNCRLTGDSILCRDLAAKEGMPPSRQVWVHEGNVERYLWDIHHRQLNHGGMDRTWAAVQQQLYGCTQSLCRIYVVSCQCVQNKTRKRKAAQMKTV